MTDLPDQNDQQGARVQALRGVVDRVTTSQETAPEGTIHDELEHGLREAGVTLTAEQRERVAEQIGAGEKVDVEALAADSEGGGPG